MAWAPWLKEPTRRSWLPHRLTLTQRRLIAAFGGRDGPVNIVVLTREHGGCFSLEMRHSKRFGGTRTDPQRFSARTVEAVAQAGFLKAIEHDEKGRPTVYRHADSSYVR